MADIKTVNDLIEYLNTIEDKSLPIEVTTGKDISTGRFYGKAYRASIKEDWKGKRILITGKLEIYSEES